MVLIRERLRRFWVVFDLPDMVLTAVYAWLENLLGAAFFGSSLQYLVRLVRHIQPDVLQLCHCGPVPLGVVTFGR